MRFYQPFPAAIPLYEAGYPRVTHPSATKWIFRRTFTPFDLHVLSTPPAFILSQDQTLMFKCLIVQKLQPAVISSRFTLVFVLKNSFGIFGIVLLFSYQWSSSVTRTNFYRISYLLIFVKNFFKSFYFSDIQRRKRDLNPRAAINDLLPFQGSPFSLLGTSP